MRPNDAAVNIVLQRLGEDAHPGRGEAADGKLAAELARQFQPDVVLMDISMLVMDGIEATRAIRTEFPHIQVIGLSMFEDVEQAQAIRAAGAADYVTKSNPAC